jgi:outer membrane autotransporter protein
MKKFVLAFLLASGLSSAAMAAEVGVRGSYDWGSNPERGGYGVTLGQKFGPAGVELGFDRYTKNEDLNKWSVVGSYDVLTVNNATFAVKAGGAYLDPSVSKNGYAALVGAGVTIPVTKSLAATVDYRYQIGQDRVSQFDGSSVLAGFKYSF